MDQVILFADIETSLAGGYLQRHHLVRGRLDFRVDPDARRRKSRKGRRLSAVTCAKGWVHTERYVLKGRTIPI